MTAAALARSEFRLNRKSGYLKITLLAWHTQGRMDVSVREELSGLVEEMTHSGSPSLDDTQLKKLKRMCRSTHVHLHTRS